MYDIEHAAAELLLEPGDLEEIYDDFFQESAGLLADFAERMAEADFVKLRQITHALKGLAANLRMDELTHLARQTEQEIIRQNITPLSGLLGEICRETEKLREQIADYYLAARKQDPKTEGE